eukprot:COSAG02_NODE_6768_length_3370_cov_5.094161_6_plen_107_part_01
MECLWFCWESVVERISREGRLIVPGNQECAKTLTRVWAKCALNIQDCERSPWYWIFWGAKARGIPWDLGAALFHANKEEWVVGQVLWAEMQEHSKESAASGLRLAAP